MEELQNEVSEEEVLQFHITNSREDTLLVRVTLGHDYSHEVMAFVDSGATFSLMNEKTCRLLDDKIFPLSIQILGG